MVFPLFRALVPFRFVPLALALAVAWGTALGRAQIAVRNQGFVPFSDAPIFYRTAPVSDPVARFQQRLDAGDAALPYDARFGYLPAVLDALAVPIDSQMLVFSKTSFQYRHISPSTPRSLYFNDDVYVGYVPGGKALEIIAFDAAQGAMFYLLDQRESARPAFQRAELDCTQCHIAAATRQVPGVLVRSVFPTPTGTQSVGARAFLTGDASPLAERFGGWYVTGRVAPSSHMGNAVVPQRSEPERLEPLEAVDGLTLQARLGQGTALTAHSDVVAQLVHAHQTQLHNLITRANYETRLAFHAAGLDVIAPPADIPPDTRARYEAPAEDLVRALLFTGEAPLESPVAGSSEFTATFAARGPRDRRGRSLRALDLHTRLFRYPCSYLVYSSAFDGLPAPALAYVHRRLVEVLDGRDRSAPFAHLTAADRRAVRDILLDTKPAFAAAWRQHDAETGVRRSTPHAQERTRR